MISDKETKGWELDDATGRYRWTYGNAKQHWVEIPGGGIFYSGAALNESRFLIEPDGVARTPDVILVKDIP